MFGLFKKNKGDSPEFRFSDSPDTACFSCRHVVSDGLPILHVSHDSDGEWQFLCGQNHEESDAKIIGIGEIVRIDPTVNRIADMPTGFAADRKTIRDDWTPYKLAE
jgi:hypothetical protein